MAYLPGEVRMPAPMQEFGLYSHGLHTHMQYSQLWDTLLFAPYALATPPVLHGRTLTQQTCREDGRTSATKDLDVGERDKRCGRRRAV